MGPQKSRMEVQRLASCINLPLSTHVAQLVLYPSGLEDCAWCGQKVQDKDHIHSCKGSQITMSRSWCSLCFCLDRSEAKMQAFQCDETCAWCGCSECEKMIHSLRWYSCSILSPTYFVVYCQKERTLPLLAPQTLPFGRRDRPPRRTTTSEVSILQLGKNQSKQTPTLALLEALYCMRMSEVHKFKSWQR